MDYAKIEHQYFLPPESDFDWVKKEYIDSPPIWCSVDLKDENQTLDEPLNQEQKLELFKLLVKIGFKEIEVGFPALSRTEYDFVRFIIERKIVPNDVVLHVPVHPGEQNIRRTFEAVRGLKKVVIHLCVPEQEGGDDSTFVKKYNEIRRLMFENMRLIKKFAETSQTNIFFKYTVQIRSNVELEFGLELCNEILESLKPDKDHKVIINLKSAPEVLLSHIYAGQVEYYNKRLKYRDHVILSIQPFDEDRRGTEKAQMGILAGAQFLEGTLFGDESGDISISHLVGDILAHGIKPGLDLSDISMIRTLYDKIIGMKKSKRVLFSGNPTFNGFTEWSNSIGDQKNDWEEYDKSFLTINSLSARNYICYILKEYYEIILPDEMQEEFANTVIEVTEKENKELTPEWIYRIFKCKYVGIREIFSLDEIHFEQKNGIFARVTISHGGTKCDVDSGGNGRLDSVSNAIKQYMGIDFNVFHFEEYLLSEESSSEVCAFVGVKFNNKAYWGAGINADLVNAAIEALESAVNRIVNLKDFGICKEKRMVDIINYIQNHYQDVTLDVLSEQFYLSKPYLSKYIKEKYGKTFGEIVKEVRMKKACILLTTSNMTIENVALNSGYPSVEHFNRIFKKLYTITPVQYRNQNRR